VFRLHVAKYRKSPVFDPPLLHFFLLLKLFLDEFFLKINAFFARIFVCSSLPPSDFLASKMLLAGLLYSPRINIL
jgi:hypothetical protein